MKNKQTDNPTITNNKKAYFNYEIMEKLEVGIVLEGSEVKSIRLGEIELRDSYVKADQGELWLLNCHIALYKFSQHNQPAPLRDRKLLIHKKQATKLIRQMKEKQYHLIPLRLYWKDGLVKVEIGLGKAKKLYDKRHALKEKDLRQEVSRGLKFR